MKRYKGDGFSVLAPDESCLFCKHCTDFFWDYTHGPYLFFCDVYDVSVDDCERFEEEVDELGERREP